MFVPSGSTSPMILPFSLTIFLGDDAPASVTVATIAAAAAAAAAV